MVLTPHDLVTEAKTYIKEITTDQAYSQLGKVLIIDVREYEEYVQGHLPSALLLPRGVLEFKIGTVNECGDKNATYLLYCRTGGRSALSAWQMKKIGYNNVYSIAGGYEAWTKEGKDVDKPPQVNDG